MQEIFNYLDNLQIDYQIHTHIPLFTMEEANEIYDKFIGGKGKSLLLKNRKGRQYYLVMVEGSKKVDLKELAQKLEQKQLSFANADKLREFLHVEPGSVSPFGLIFDKNQSLQVVFDQDILKHKHVFFHPNQNNQTLELSSDDMKLFLKSLKNKIDLFYL